MRVRRPIDHGTGSPSGLRGRLRVAAPIQRRPGDYNSHTAIIAAPAMASSAA